MVNLSKEKFLTLFPKADKRIVDILIEEIKNNEINTPDRIRYFLSQCAHESCSFSVFEENLNYSVKGLMSVFGKYFTDEKIALAYARKPMQIANRVYANRIGNGDEKSGDGWKYHGRGIVQLTGKSNYEKFAKYLNKPLEECVTFCSTPEGIVKSAMYFWKTNNCNSYADSKNFIKLTKVINGGTNGLEDRTKQLNRIEEITKSWLTW